MKRRILLTFLFLILPLSFNACGAGEFPEAEGTLEPSPLVSISGGGDAGSAASPDCHLAGTPAMRQRVINSSACSPQSPRRFTAENSPCRSSVAYPRIKE